MYWLKFICNLPVNTHDTFDVIWTMRNFHHLTWMFPCWDWKRQDFDFLFQFSHWKQESLLQCIYCFILVMFMLSDSWGRKESDRTERLNWTELNWYFPLVIPLFKMGPEWELKCYIVCLSAGDQDVPYEENRWVIKLPSDLRSRGVGCEFSVNQSTINFKRCL